MRPRKRTNTTMPPNLHMQKKGRNCYFSYRNPVTGKRTGIGTDRQIAIKTAHNLNAKILRQPENIDTLSQKVFTAGETMNGWLDDYWKIISEQRGLGSNTLRTRKSHVKYIREHFGSYVLNDIETSHIADFLRMYIDKGLARTAQAMRSALLDIFKTAIEEGKIKYNPVESTRMPKAEVKRSRLSLEEFYQILEIAGGKDPWIANSMLLALVTTQRVSDIALMKFSDVRDNWLHVEQVKNSGKLNSKPTRLKLSLDIRLEAINLSLSDVITRCRDIVVSKHMIHHTKNRTKSNKGNPVHESTISRR